MKLYICFVQLLVAILYSCLVLTQAQQNYVESSSTYGQEFFIGFLPTLGGSVFNSTGVWLTVGTPDVMADFVVQSSNRIIYEGNVTLNNPVRVAIPAEFIVTDSSYVNRHKGIHILAMGDNRLFVLAETLDVFLLGYGTFLAYPIPQPSLSQNISEYEYIVMSIDDPLISESIVLLVAFDDNTSIIIQPSQRIQVPEDLQASNYTLITVEMSIRSHELFLNRGQTLLILENSDLTGTKIIATKPLTVISGHRCANIPPGLGCEPLAVQIPPVTTWGTKFLLAPFTGRNDPQLFRVVADNDTTLRISCGNSSAVTALTTNSIYTLATYNYCYVESANPIFLVQISTGNSEESQGDAAIAIVSPIDQYIHEIDFFSVSFPTDYISITVAADHYDPDSFLLDGTVLSCSWQEIYNSTRNIVGYGCSKNISSGNTSTIQHRISYSLPNGSFSVTAYGFARGAGYAYLTGQLLKITRETFDDTDMLNPGIDFLPYFDLEHFPGMMELSRGERNPVSDQIVIPQGFIFGRDIVSILQVNENGVISFNGQPWRFSYPQRFPTGYYWTRNGLAVAPFWSDNDIRRSGAVRYAVYSSSEGASNQRGQEILDEVNCYIQAQQPEGEETFTGRWILIAHWDHVHPSPHGDEDHRGIPEEELEKTNNYQAMIVTNNMDTYAIFTYMCGELEWSSVGGYRGAVIGYNARGDYFTNHPLSGFSSVGDSVACTFQLARRQKRQTTQTNNLVMKLPVDEQAVQMIADCTAALNFDTFVFLLGTDPQDLADRLDPCPPISQVARDDFGRFILQEENFPSSRCYVSARSLNVSIFTTTLFLTQQCCYYDLTGALQTSTNDIYPGTMLVYHPLYNFESYNRTDKALREACCGQGGANMYCNMFFGRRPIISHENYLAPGSAGAPAVASGRGDPHYSTFDGRYHTFNGQGEYILLEVRSNGSRDEPISLFTLQGRTEPSLWPATTHRALAFGSRNLAFHIGMTPGFKLFQTRPEHSIQEITLESGQSWPNRVNRNIKLTRNGNQLKAAFYEHGIALVINVYERPTEYHIDFEVRVPKSFSGRTRGFLGNLDNDPTNEFYRRSNSGTLQSVSESVSERDLFHVLDDTWRIGHVDADDNLFYRPDSRRKRQIANTTFVPLFFDELNFTSEQMMICENNQQCLFDLVVTGDMEIASNTLQFEKSTNTTKETFDNFPPRIFADSVFRVNIGEESIYILSVSDPDGDNFTLTLMNELPDDPTIESRENGEYLFQWTLVQITNTTLTFIANDSKGASATFSPTVELCACVNEGNCTLDGLLTSNSTIVMGCHCSPAFSGDFCEEDRDGCSEIQCFEGVECRDVPAPGVGAVCGACPEGYTGDTVKCYDINECSQNATICDQLCINTDSSFLCACLEGYHFREGSNQCEDINECQQGNDCRQVCQNTEGSFLCSCTEGFILAEDGKNCTANQACSVINRCSDMCAIIDGEEQCFCPIGFELSTPEGAECVDLDECQSTAPCDQLCTNTLGSYECGCTSGYELQQDGQSCEDIDECLVAALTSMDACENDENTECINILGFYNCSCVPGYGRLNGSCHRIEEIIPPPSPVVSPITAGEFSLNFTASTVVPFSFTPDKQQIFREITAVAVNDYCSTTNCSIILGVTGERQKIIGLRIAPYNVAIPTSLIGHEDEQLVFTYYIQIMNNYLTKEDLLEAIQQASEQYRATGFLPTAISPTQQPTDQPGIPFCNCERHVECIIDGKFLTESNVQLLAGTEMKCSVNPKVDLVMDVKDKAIIDETFDTNYLSPGSLLFLRQLGVIIEPLESTQACNTSSFIKHWNPGVVLRELGLAGLSLNYLVIDGKFDSLYLNTQDLQTLPWVTNSDLWRNFSQILGPENACSFQTLLYFLTTGSSYLLEGVTCKVTGRENTVVQLIVHCE